MKTLDIIMALCFAASCLSANAQHYAVVNLSVNFLREAPGYTTELGTQALMGDIVEITDEKGYWCKVVTEEPYTAWCTDLGLVRMDAEEIREYKAAPKYICTAWKSTVYSCPSRKSLKICDIVEGDLLRQSRKTVTRRMDIEGKAPVTAMEIQRYRRPVTRKGFAEVVLPDGRKGYVSRKDIMDYRKWEAGCSPTAENIISEAMKFIEHAEGIGYSDDICSYARVNMGYVDIQHAEAQDIPLPDLIFSSTNICNTVLKWYENIAKKLHIPLILFDMPFNHTYEVADNATAYIRGQLENAIRQLEEFTGRKMDYDKLAQKMDMNNKASIHWACRRGMRELDISIMPFFEHEYDSLSDDEKRIFICIKTKKEPCPVL